MRRQYRLEMALRRIEVVQARILRIIGSGVELDTGASVDADLVVVAGTPRSDRQVLSMLPDGVGVATSGDAKQAGSIMDAIAEAQDVPEAIG